MTIRKELCIDEVIEFDKQRFDQPEWQLQEWRDQKTRHIALHIAKLPKKILLLGKFDGRIITSEVIPDMALYRTQLIHTHQVPEEQLVHLPSDAAVQQSLRFQSQGVPALALERIALAGSHLAEYLEPAEHGVAVSEPMKRANIIDAATDLHVGAAALALAHNMSLQDSLQTRLSRHLAISAE